MARITVKLQPRASSTAITGLDATGAIRVRVTAPPVLGAANDALIALLAESLHIARSRISIINGHTGRTKLVEVAGMDARQVRSLLRPKPGPAQRGQSSQSSA